jgi:hypothetical protein
MLELTCVDYTGNVLGPGYFDPDAVVAVLPLRIVTGGGSRELTQISVGGTLFPVMETVALVMEKLDALFAEEDDDDAGEGVL